MPTINFRTILFLGLYAAAATAAPIPKELKTKPDAERMLGVWDMPISKSGGANDYTKAQWTFSPGKMVSVTAGAQPGTVGTEWTIKLDAEKNPKEIDIGTYKGIYEFDGDKLKVAYNLGGERPTKLTPESAAYYCELKYIGEAPKK